MHETLIRKASRLLGQADVPGLSLGLVEDGKVTLEVGLGVADRASRRRVGTWTNFQAASVADPVVAGDGHRRPIGLAALGVMFLAV